jgi:energy-coupling factor transporter ATP-binding protein EcfA2
MELKTFRVMNFRSVNDSGPIEVGERTVLVGRNESGKTNLLLALASLKPPDGMPELTFVKDFPRDRMRDEFSEDVRPLETIWELTDKEQRELGGIFPRAKDVREVTIGRYYHKRNRWVRFEGLPRFAVDTEVVNDNLGGIQRSANASLRGKDTDKVDGFVVVVDHDLRRHPAAVVESLCPLRDVFVLYPLGLLAHSRLLLPSLVFLYPEEALYIPQRQF